MPVQTFRPDGSVIFDSDTAPAGVCIGLHFYASGQAETRTYPSLAGADVRALSLYGSNDPLTAVDYSLGYPRLTIGSATGARLISVWAVTPPTITPGPGIQAVNQNGALVLTSEGFGLYYVGQPWLHAVVENSGGPTGRVMGRRIYRINSANPVVPVIRLDAGWYSQLLSVTNLGGGLWEIEAIHISAGSYDGTGLRAQGAPTIACFARPTVAQTNPEASISDTSGAVSWDLMRSDWLRLHARPDLSSPTVTSAPIPWAASIGVLGWSGGWYVQSTFEGSGYNVVTSNYFWSRDSTNVIRGAFETQLAQEDAPITLERRRAVSPILIDLTGIA